jgi:hypothetical protein
VKTPIYGISTGPVIIRVQWVLETAKNPRRVSELILAVTYKSGYDI